MRASRGVAAAIVTVVAVLAGGCMLPRAPGQRGAAPPPGPPAAVSSGAFRSVAVDASGAVLACGDQGVLRVAGTPAQAAVVVPPASGACRSVAFDPWRPGEALVATGHDVLRSTDGGRTWMTFHAYSAALSAVIPAGDDPERAVAALLASPAGGAVESADVQDSVWTRATGLTREGQLGLAVAPGDPHAIWVIDEQSRTLHASADGGRSFRPLAGRPPAADPAAPLLATGDGAVLYYGRARRLASTGRWSVMASWPVDDVVAATDGAPVRLVGWISGPYEPFRLAVSGDGGVTWYELRLSDRQEALPAAVFAPDGSLWVAADDGLYHVIWPNGQALPFAAGARVPPR